MRSTGKLGLLKVISESSVAAGVRRIEAVTGFGVYDLLEQREEQIFSAAAALKVTNPAELVHKAEIITAELKEKDKEIEALRSQMASGQIQGLLASAQNIDGIRFISAVLKDVSSDALRSMTDKLKEDIGTVAVLASINGEKATIAACAGKEAIKKGAHAGNLVREVAKLAGGNGGGRPDSAMAGAKDIAKVEAALENAQQILKKML